MPLSDDDQAAVDRFNGLDLDGDGVDRSVEDATVEAVKAARAAGVITDMDAGAVAVLLRMAERMDDPDFPYVEGRFDNVTEGLFVKTARELGLTAGGRALLPERKEAKRGKLSVLRDEQAARTGTAGVG